MLSMFNNNITTSLPIWILTNFFFLSDYCKTSNTILKSSGESGNPYIIADFSRFGGGFQLCNVECYISCAFIINSFIISRHVPSIPTFIRVFITKNVEFY